MIITIILLSILFLAIAITVLDCAGVLRPLFCKLCGHSFEKHDEYAKFGDSSTIDGIGTEHRNIVAECSVCGSNFQLCKIHIDKTAENTLKQEKEALIAANNALDAQLKEERGIGKTKFEPKKAPKAPVKKTVAAKKTVKTKVK